MEKRKNEKGRKEEKEEKKEEEEEAVTAANNNTSENDIPTRTTTTTTTTTTTRTAITRSRVAVERAGKEVLLLQGRDPDVKQGMHTTPTSWHLGGELV